MSARRRGLLAAWILLWLTGLASARADDGNYLFVVSQNHDASVIVNSKVVGKIIKGYPCPIRLTDGRYNVLIRQDGRQSSGQLVWMNGLSQRISLNLETTVSVENLLIYVLPLVTVLFVLVLRQRYKSRRKGLLLGQYRPIRELSKGRFTEVLLVENVKEKRNAVLKTLNIQHSDDHDTIEKFRREGRIIRSIKTKHPEARVPDVFRMQMRADGIHFIEMEYIEGESLLDKLKKTRRIPEALTISMVSLISETLSQCHDVGIYHRDLSPDNIIIDSRSRQPFLIDFGIAKNEFTTYQTLDGSISGKPAYMSPEQCTGEKVSAASDVYSLGILWFVLLEGYSPFESDNIIDIIRKQTEMDLPKLSPHLSACVGGLITQMTRKDPSKRITLEYLRETIRKMNEFN